MTGLPYQSGSGKDALGGSGEVQPKRTDAGTASRPPANETSLRATDRRTGGFSVRAFVGCTELAEVPVLQVAVLTLLTMGLYYPVWFLRRLEAFNRLHSNTKLREYPLYAAFVCLVLMCVLWFASGVVRSNVPPLQMRHDDSRGYNVPAEGIDVRVRTLAHAATTHAVGSLFAWAGVIIMLLQSFRARQILQDHFGTHLRTKEDIGGVGTFLFHMWYLQYKLNILLATQSSGPASIGTPVPSVPDPSGAAPRPLATQQASVPAEELTPADDVQFSADESALFAKAMAESDDPAGRHAGAWARAFSEASESAQNARALYIKYRVSLLKEERRIRLREDAEQQRRQDECKRQAQAETAERQKRAEVEAAMREGIEERKRALDAVRDDLARVAAEIPVVSKQLAELPDMRHSRRRLLVRAGVGAAAVAAVGCVGVTVAREAGFLTLLWRGYDASLGERLAICGQYFVAVVAWGSAAAWTSGSAFVGLVAAAAFYETQPTCRRREELRGQLAQLERKQAENRRRLVVLERACTDSTRRGSQDEGEAQ